MLYIWVMVIQSVSNVKLKVVLYYTGWWFQPFWKTWKSVGIIIPNTWKFIKFHGSSQHQPVYLLNLAQNEIPILHPNADMKRKRNLAAINPSGSAASFHWVKAWRLTWNYHVVLLFETIPTLWKAMEVWNRGSSGVYCAMMIHHPHLVI